VASAAKTEPASSVHAGVAPLRAGQGIHFWLRKLQSLSGIIPIGAFLLEHFISNAFATNGPHAYNEQVRFLTSFPFVPWLEFFGIFLPILFHSFYGFYIWWRGDSNVGPSYPWMGNWMYTAQRWTGIIAFIYMSYHVYTMRFSGVHLMTNSAAAFTKVYEHFQNPLVVAFYFVGIIAASWHFSYGLWLFTAKWGIITGPNGQKKFGYVCLALGLALVAIGTVTMLAFLTTPASQVPAVTESYLMH
jgi:succinate dehydrogenase cytochrome b subunit